MKEMLKFELRKLLRMKSLYVCAALLVLQIFLMTSVMSGSRIHVDGEVTKPAMWSLLLSAAGLIPIPLAIFASVYAVCDFSEETIKTILSKGYSRTQRYFSQIIMLVAVCVVYFLVSELSSVIFGAIYLRRVMRDGILLSIFFQLPVIIAYGVFFFSIASLFKGMGGAIATTVFLDVPILPLLFDFVNGCFSKQLDEAGIDLTDYWLRSMVISLQKIELTDKIIATALIGSAIYFIIFVAIGYLIVRRREV